MRQQAIGDQPPGEPLAYGDKSQLLVGAAPGIGGIQHGITISFFTGIKTSGKRQRLADADTPGTGHDPDMIDPGGAIGSHRKKYNTVSDALAFPPVDEPGPLTRLFRL